MIHAATIHAYKNTDGKFNAAMVISGEETQYIMDCETYEKARHEAKMMAWDKFGPVRYAAIGRTKKRYQANVWKDAA